MLIHTVSSHHLSAQAFSDIARRSSFSVIPGNKILLFHVALLVRYLDQGH